MSDNPETPRSRDETPEPAVRLSPPPKVAPASTVRAAAVAARRARADRGLVYWLTGLVFLTLGATAFAVFVFLPDWVPEPDAGAPAPEAVAGAMSTEEPTEITEQAAPALETLPETKPETPAEPPARLVTEPRGEAPTRSSAAPILPAKKAVDPTEASFRESMTTGLDHLDRGELGSAREAFQLALTLRPDSAEARDGLTRVESERQLLAIADHRERAAGFESQERWAAAAAEHAAVLALDPTIRFAQEGRERSEARQSLSEKLDSHIAHPDRLSSDQVLADARTVLREAREVATPGPVLARQIERLAAQIAVAETPVRIVLLSDELTDVMVYRVGRLGTFERRELDLRPGTYTVVGTRDGYRDVRFALEVVPDKKTLTLTVRCEEKI